MFSYAADIKDLFQPIRVFHKPSFFVIVCLFNCLTEFKIDSLLSVFLEVLSVWLSKLGNYPT